MTTAADANPTTIADRVAKMHEVMVGQIPDEVLGAFVAEQAGLDTRGIPTSIAEPGDTLGDFDLLDVHGAPTTVSTALGGRTAVIVLYRGAWCPYCNLALRAYQDDLAPTLADKGIALVAISPQKPDGSLSAQEKNELTFTVLSDPGNKIANRLGVMTAPTQDAQAAQRAIGIDLPDANADGTYGLPMPTVVIVDGTGVICWIDVHPNYTTRTEASDILAALHTLPVPPGGGPAVTQHKRGTAPPPHTSSPSATQRVSRQACLRISLVKQPWSSEESRCRMTLSVGSGSPESSEPDQPLVVEHDGYGFPSRLWRGLDRYAPPGVSLLRRWRSPLRGPWLTSVLGLMLLITLPIVIITGLLSYIAYGPQFGQAIPFDVGWLKLPTFDWPTKPSWLYRLNQGLHVGLGLVLIPVVLAKLWSVIPRLFTWPPARSVAQVLERVSLVMLVGGILFEIATGVLNIQYDYIFGFSFYTAHYFGAWVFVAGFVMHITLKIPRMLTGLRSMSLREVLRTNRADTRPEPPDPDGLVAADPAPATISRRGALALVGGGALLVAAATAGQTIGGWTRQTALLLPRGQVRGDGPTDFQVNRTAIAAGITPNSTGDTWRLTLRGGPAPVVLDRGMLTAMPQHTARLPIACVEGWSTTETWSGVRLRDLARLAGVPAPQSASVESLERFGAFNHAVLQGNQVEDPDSLLALRVNGAELSLDHGYPARIIVPALPGVHNTKWVASIDFRAG